MCARGAVYTSTRAHCTSTLSTLALRGSGARADPGERRGGGTHGGTANLDRAPARRAAVRRAPRPPAPRAGRVRVCSRPDPCVAARGRARDAGAGVVYVHFASRTAVFHCQLNHAHAVDTCYTSHLSGTLFSLSPTLSPSLSLSLSAPLFIVTLGRARQRNILRSLLRARQETSSDKDASHVGSCLPGTVNREGI